MFWTEVWQEAIESTKVFSVSLFLIGAIFFMLEKIRPAERTGFLKPGFGTDLGLAVFNKFLVIPFLAVASGYAGAMAMDYNLPYQLTHPYLYAAPLAAQIFLALLFMDFSTYWRHRLMHRFLWPVHAVHHSAQHISWITGLRLHPVEICVAAFIDGSFMYVVGFQSDAISWAILASLFYNYFLHANIDLAYPRPLRYLLASPFFHRWHHAIEKEAYNKNFCGMFSLLDILFGTYHHPVKGLPQAYGLTPAEQARYPAPFAAQLLYPVKKLWKKKKA